MNFPISWHLPDLRRRLVPALLGEGPVPDPRAIARAGGELPQGEIGRVIEEEQLAIAAKFAERLRQAESGGIPSPCRSMCRWPGSASWGGSTG